MDILWTYQGHIGDVLGHIRDILGTYEDICGHIMDVSGTYWGRVRDILGTLLGPQSLPSHKRSTGWGLSTY